MSFLALTLLSGGGMNGSSMWAATFRIRLSELFFGTIAGPLVATFLHHLRRFEDQAALGLGAAMTSKAVLRQDLLHLGKLDRLIAL